MNKVDLIKLVESKPLYFQVLYTLLDLRRKDILSTPSNIAKALGKEVSTVSEPLNFMLTKNILEIEKGKDKRRRVYSFIDFKSTEEMILKLKNSEVISKTKSRLSSESFKFVKDIELKINNKIKEITRKINNKIQVFENYPLKTMFGNQNIDLVISTFDKIRIGIEYKLILSEKRFRESRINRIKRLLSKKYFKEIIGNYVCTEEGEIDGQLLVLVISGLDQETKIILEEVVKKLKKKDFNLDIIISDLKTGDIQKEIVLEDLVKSIISKVDDLRDNALNKQKLKEEKFVIEKKYLETPEILSISEKEDIALIGIGGAGNNVGSWTYQKGLKGAEIILLNSDEQHLNISDANKKILIGKNNFKGVGCAGDIKNGEIAVKEDENEIRELLKDRILIFLVAGLGGGLGSGGIPIVAKFGKELNIPVISIVTLPFIIEKSRISKALKSLKNVVKNSDITVVLDNNKLINIAGNLPVRQAFAVGNELIATVIKGIVETIKTPSLINLDYGDLKTIMKSGKFATIGVSASDTSNRVEEVGAGIINSLLYELDEIKGVLMHIDGGPDLTFDEIEKIAMVITNEMEKDTNIIWSATVNEDMKGKIAVTALFIGDKKIKPNKPEIEINELIESI